MESLNTNPLTPQFLPSSLNETKGIRETNDDKYNLSIMLRRFEKEAGHWIQESPAESTIRIRGLRKITFALFALGMSLTCFLNSRLLLQGVELQQLIVCNLGIMIVYVLAGICLLHDVTFKRKTGYQKEALDVANRLEIVAQQIEELDALRFKTLYDHNEMVASQMDLSQTTHLLSSEFARESEKAAQAKESIASAQAELNRTLASIEDKKAELEGIQQAVAALRIEFEAERLEDLTWIADQQSEIENLKAQHNQYLAVTEQSLAATNQAQESAQAMNREMDNLQTELQSLENLKSASIESGALLKLELMDIENALSESKLTLTMTQEECQKVTEALVSQQDSLHAIQEKHSELLLEIELIESERDISQSNLASRKIELACVELECFRVQSHSAELDQLNATIVLHEQSILDMEQERSLLQRNIEYSNAMEAVAANRLATLNEQVTKLDSDIEGLSESLERQLGEIEEKSRVREGLANQNMSATASLESLLDSVEQLSKKEAALLSACSSAEHKLENWNSSVASLVTRVDELTPQITHFELQRVQAIEALEGLLEEIDLKSADRTTLANTIEVTKQQILDLDAETQFAKTRLEIAQSAMRDAQSAMRDLESAMRDATDQLQSYESRISLAAESCLTQHAELSMVQDELVNQQSALTQLKSLVVLMAEDKLITESELVSLEKSKNETAVACEDANAELDRIIRQLATLSEDLLVKEKQSLHLNTLLEQVQESEEQIRLQRQKLDEIDRQQNESEHACNTAREELFQWQADARTVQQELNRLNQAESELMLKCNNTRSENDQLEADRNSLNSKLLTLKHELSTSQVKRSQLESEIQASEQRMVDIQRTLDGYANEANEAQAVCKQWADYGAELRIDNKEVESEIAKLRSKSKELRGEQERSLQEIQTLSTELATLRNQRETLQSEIINREDFLIVLKEEQKQIIKETATKTTCLEQAQADLDRLASECNSAKFELDGMNNQRRIEGTYVQELMVQHQQLRGEVSGQAQVLEKMRAEAVQNASALDNQKANRALMESSISEAKAQQLDLANHLSTMQRELAIVSESVVAAVDQEQKQLDEIHSLQSKADECRSQINSLQQQSKTMEFEMNENRENLKQLDSKLETTRNDFQQAEHLLIEGQNKVQGIVRSITEREMELIETEESISEKQKQNQALDLDLSSKNAVLDAIKQALADTEIKSTEQQSQLGQAQESLELLRSQAAELEDTLIGLSGQKMEADASIAFAASQTKDLRNLIEALENEKTSLVRLLETKKTQLDTTLQERVQLESANRKLIESNDQEVQAIHDLQSRRDELTKHVSDLDHELSLNKENESQLQTQIEVSSAQIAQLEQNRRDWMGKESTIIQQVTRLHSELKNLESQQLQASQDLETLLVPTQSIPKWVPNRRWVKLLPKRSESIQPTTMELAQEILEDIAELAILDDEMVGQGIPANESDIIDSSPSEPSKDPWSVVLN